MRQRLIRRLHRRLKSILEGLFHLFFLFLRLCFFLGGEGVRPLLSKEGQKNNRKEGRIMIIPSITPRTIIIITMSILITVAYKCSYYRCIYKEINI